VKPATAPSALRVQAALGDAFEVLEFEESTRTAADAAAAIGCTVAQIAKSMIFRAAESDRPVLVITSGSVRVDAKKVADILGENVKRASPEFVRDNTGYAIGGVPPVAHRVEPIVLIDETLFNLECLWAAAGTPNAVFRLLPDDLSRLTAGVVADIAEA
jgi:prolyl-tRNA editing enzyme YbaK/EbsC (Cys-tRNA(Pro) deacylase)